MANPSATRVAYRYLQGRSTVKMKPNLVMEVVTTGDGPASTEVEIKGQQIHPGVIDGRGRQIDPPVWDVFITTVARITGDIGDAGHIPTRMGGVIDTFIRDARKARKDEGFV
jgi:hypothetical protein